MACASCGKRRAYRASSGAISRGPVYRPRSVYRKAAMDMKTSREVIAVDPNPMATITTNPQQGEIVAGTGQLKSVVVNGVQDPSSNMTGEWVNKNPETHGYGSDPKEASEGPEVYDTPQEELNEK